MSVDWNEDWHCEVCGWKNDRQTYPCSHCLRVPGKVETSDGNTLTNPVYFITRLGSVCYKGRGMSLASGFFISTHEDRPEHRHAMLSVSGGDVHNIRITPVEWPAIRGKVDGIMQKLSQIPEEEAA